jgi:hypothetical protein
MKQKFVILEEDITTNPFDEIFFEGGRGKKKESYQFNKKEDIDIETIIDAKRFLLRLEFRTEIISKFITLKPPFKTIFPVLEKAFKNFTIQWFCEFKTFYLDEYEILIEEQNLRKNKTTLFTYQDIEQEAQCFKEEETEIDEEEEEALTKEAIFLSLKGLIEEEIELQKKFSKNWIMKRFYY